MVPIIVRLPLRKSPILGTVFWANSHIALVQSPEACGGSEKWIYSLPRGSRYLINKELGLEGPKTMVIMAFGA